MKGNIEEYTEADFKKLVQDICSVNAKNEEEHTQLVRLFCRLTQHPEGSDLIYYPDNEADATPEPPTTRDMTLADSGNIPLLSPFLDTSAYFVAARSCYGFFAVLRYSF